MPFLNGRRVTLAEWREENPVGPIYRRDYDGQRRTVYPGDRPDVERAGTVRQKSLTDMARQAAILDALGDDAFEGEVVFGEEREPIPPVPLAPRLTREREEEPDEPEGEAIAVPARHEPVVNSEPKGWEPPEGQDPRRFSQTPEGRHLRLIRANAKALGVTEAEADARTGGRHTGCPWRRQNPGGGVRTA